MYLLHRFYFHADFFGRVGVILHHSFLKYLFVNLKNEILYWKLEWGCTTIIFINFFIKRRQFSFSEAHEFLNAHNEKRRIVRPSAANMREMVRSLFSRCLIEI